MNTFTQLPNGIIGVIVHNADNEPGDTVTVQIGMLRQRVTLGEFVADHVQGNVFRVAALCAING